MQNFGFLSSSSYTPWVRCHLEVPDFLKPLCQAYSRRALLFLPIVIWWSPNSELSIKRDYFLYNEEISVNLMIFKSEPIYMKPQKVIRGFKESFQHSSIPNNDTFSSIPHAGAEMNFETLYQITGPESLSYSIESKYSNESFGSVSSIISLISSEERLEIQNRINMENYQKETKKRFNRCKVSKGTPEP